MALINEETEGATPPMTEPLTHESLAELRRDAESWLMIGGERVLPLLNALDAARAERDALAATVERAAHAATREELANVRAETGSDRAMCFSPPQTPRGHMVGGLITDGHAGQRLVLDAETGAES